MSHTPGPWTIETVPTQIGHCHKIMPMVACLYVDHRGSDFKDQKTLTAKADAHLMAAAPDMLAALREAANAVTFNVEAEEGHRVLGIINAAIAKAEAKA